MLTEGLQQTRVIEKFGLIKQLFSRKRILPTLLVLAGMAVMARLGVWQLDRLAQRRANNARVLVQVSQPPLDLNTAPLQDSAWQASLVDMQYRKAVVTGEYDFSQQVVLKDQIWQNQVGVHLLTPFHISGSNQVILVDRGWIPQSDFSTGALGKYDQAGVLTVTGVIRDSQNNSFLGLRADPKPAPGQDKLTALYNPNIPLIAGQVPYPLLPVYIQQAPDPALTSLPFRSQPSLDLSDGPHLSYAIQWFSFTIILGVGYLFLVRHEIRGKETISDDKPAENQ